MSDPKMRVLQLSMSDLMGGAAIAAHRLNGALCDTGVDSKMFVINRTSPPNDRRIVQMPLFSALPEKVAQFCYRVCRRIQNPVRCADDNTLFSMDWTCYRSLPLRFMPAVDIVNLHWVAGLLDYKAMLPPMASMTPLVWTFHDMNAFTGGCHYSGDCDRFTGSCGRCPKLLSEQEEDRSRRVFERKLAALTAIAEDRLTVVSPSQWLADESSRSTLFRRFRHAVIPNGIDVSQFQITDRKLARQKLGLDEKDRVVLFVADHVSDRRKGLALLLEALEGVGDLPGLRIMTMGQGDTSRMTGERYRHLGRLHDARQIALAYGAADVFVIPSLQDNLPNTILEAMACGTPVIGFDAGGIADAVRRGETGLLAPAGDTACLARHLRLLLEDTALNRRMSVAARQRAEEHYTVKLQAERYHALYASLLENQNKKKGPPSPAAAARP